MIPSLGQRSELTWINCSSGWKETAILNNYIETFCNHEDMKGETLRQYVIGIGPASGDQDISRCILCPVFFGQDRGES